MCDRCIISTEGFCHEYRRHHEQFSFWSWDVFLVQDKVLSCSSVRSTSLPRGTCVAWFLMIDLLVNLPSLLHLLRKAQLADSSALEPCAWQQWRSEVVSHRLHCTFSYPCSHSLTNEHSVVECLDQRGRGGMGPSEGVARLLILWNCPLAACGNPSRKRHIPSKESLLQ